MTERPIMPQCVVCLKPKTPMGRDAPAASAGAYCDWDCEGYRQDPLPSSLWPGEERESDILLPCPFCGEQPRIYGGDDPYYKLTRACCPCGVSGAYFNTVKEAAAAWNTRATLYTDDETNAILERFDQTDSSVQRQIVMALADRCRQLEVMLSE